MCLCLQTSDAVIVVTPVHMVMLLVLKPNENRLLAVSLIPLSPKATTNGELLRGDDLERKELGMEGKKGEVRGK